MKINLFLKIFLIANAVWAFLFAIVAGIIYLSGDSAGKKNLAEQIKLNGVQAVEVYPIRDKNINYTSAIDTKSIDYNVFVYKFQVPDDDIKHFVNAIDKGRFYQSGFFHYDRKYLIVISSGVNRYYMYYWTDYSLDIKGCECKEYNFDGSIFGIMKNFDSWSNDNDSLDAHYYCATEEMSIIMRNIINEIASNPEKYRYKNTIKFPENI